MNSSQNSPNPETAPRPKIKQLEVMVAEVIRETPDAATLVLFTGNDRLEYKPGHFLTIDPHQFPALERFIDYFEDLKGKKEPARAYSLTSAPHEPYLAVTVKEERYIPDVTVYPPLLSPLLVWRIQPGTRMVVTGFGGPYVLPDDIEDRTDHLVHICAGSGAVPNMSILKHALATAKKLRHTFVYGNKTRQDIIFRRELDELAHQHSDRLKVFYALSRETNVAGYGENYHNGRVDGDLVRQHITDPSAVEVFACGPAVGKWDRLAAQRTGQPPKPRFMESVLEALESLGVSKDRIHRESYG
jgi:3-ketosteroid 9alpha-monooxygenase subunit B